MTPHGASADYRAISAGAVRLRPKTTARALPAHAGAVIAHALSTFLYITFLHVMKQGAGDTASLGPVSNR